VGRVLGVACGVIVIVTTVGWWSLHPPVAHVTYDTGPTRGVDASGRPVWYGYSSSSSAMFHSYPMVRMLPTFVGGALAIAGALLLRPGLLVAGFALGFFTFYIGIYTVGLPLGPLSAIGYGEIGYLIAALLISLGARRPAPRD